MPARVALTMRITEAAGYAERRDSISHEWLARLGEWGCVPLLVPNGIAEPERYLEGLGADLLVLTGGEDVGVEPERDATETRLYDFALARGIAVLGVCRGLQLVNLRQEGRLVRVQGHRGTPHEVAIADAWRSIYGARARVNSYHDNAIPADGLGRGLVALAHDDRGRIEAFAHRDRPLAAVMWHPERPGAPAGDRELVARLIAEGAFWR